MDWQAETINLIQESFKNLGIKYKPTGDVHSCLVDFMNLDLKLIKPIPRKVYVSKELAMKGLPAERKRALRYIANKIQDGIDINRHKNKATFEPTLNDPLLNDWLIHHLHVSDTKEQKNQRFYDRTKYILFVAITKDQAFFIDVRSHGKNEDQLVFARKELLEIMDRNWPGILQDHNSEDIFTSVHSPTDEQIDTARKAGLSYGMTLINGRMVINPGLGITTSKHNIHVVRRANAILRLIMDAIDTAEERKDELLQDLSKAKGNEIKQLDLQIQRVNEWPFFVVNERNSGFNIWKNYETEE